MRTYFLYACTSSWKKKKKLQMCHYNHEKWSCRQRSPWNQLGRRYPETDSFLFVDTCIWRRDVLPCNLLKKLSWLIDLFMLGRIAVWLLSISLCHQIILILFLLKLNITHCIYGTLRLICQRSKVMPKCVESLAYLNLKLFIVPTSAGTTGDPQVVFRKREVWVRVWF